jgi:hypothetical protein
MARALALTASDSRAISAPMLATLHSALTHALILSSTSDQPSSIEVRFYPREGIYSYPLDSVRGWDSALLQNAAVIWRGEQPLVVTGIDLELLVAKV